MSDPIAPSEPPGLSEALEFAALSGPFDPAAALRIAATASKEAAAEVASALAAACDTNPDQYRNWLLLSPNREAILDQLRSTGRLGEAISRRRSTTPDQMTSDLLDALSNIGNFTAQQVERALSSTNRDWLVRIATALDWAGGLAAASGLLERSRTAIKNLERKARREEIMGVPFVGRDDEIKKLMGYLTATPRREVRGVFMSGPPGIGKSALMERVIARHYDEFHSVIVRLDFDRAGLDVTDLRVLTMEAARQVADRVGDSASDLLAARMRTASLQEGSESILQTRRTFPTGLAAEIARTLNQANRPLLVVVDTLETLQARGATHLDQLFNWLQQLFEEGIQRMAVLAAGRAAPPDTFRKVAGEVSLEGLSPPAAIEFAEKLKVDARDRAAVAERAAYVPLAIKLAADIVRSDGIEALPAKKLNPKFASAMLYRILLSRIDDETLKELAHPGLIVRRISADLLREVIAPEVGLPNLGLDEAKTLFDALALQHWLVEVDPQDPNFVRHRPDIRHDLLPLLYQDDPTVCAKIDRRAMKWFAARDEPESEVDALYHRLQLLRRPGPRPAIPEDIAGQFDDVMLSELPEAAQVLVKQVAGQFSGVGLKVSNTQSASDNSRLVRELVNIIAKSDWLEGRDLVRRIQDTGAIDPRGRVADAVRAFWWRSGQWHDANWLLRERDRLGEDDSDLAQLEPPLALARLEMRGEYGKAAQFLQNPGMLSNSKEWGSTATALSRHGGLAFRLRAIGMDPASMFGTDDIPDPTGAALERWTTVQQDSWNESIFAFVHRRFASVGAQTDIQAPSWVKSQIMTSMTPYAGLAVILSQSNSMLSVRAAEAVESFLGHHSPLKLADAISLSPSGHVDIEPITAIANMGLFSEWAEALGFVLGEPNLRSLGRAADNWRRTMAGDWRYGRRRPRGWMDVKIDEVLRARIWRIHDSEMPEELAYLQLRAWVPHINQGEAVWALIRERAPNALESAWAAQRKGGYEAAAAKLRSYRIPTAFVPSIITLNGLRH